MKEEKEFEYDGLWGVQPLPEGYKPIVDMHELCIVVGIVCGAIVFATCVGWVLRILK